MLQSPGSTVRHFFSVDVEEYFQVSAFDGVVDRGAWLDLPSRVSESVDRLLALLGRHGATGTFFTLGWIADRYPLVVQRIAEAGHEVASHGWSHRRVSTLSPVTFRDEVRRSRHVLQELTGQGILGYRAPSFSILPGGEWAFDVLIDEGHTYDSSVFPIRRPGYGSPGAPRVPHVIERPGGRLYEFPMTTTVLAGVRIPAAGGGYFRHFPYAVTRRALREYAEAGTSAMFYIHPWEIDADQPRVNAPWLTRYRHYAGIGRTEARLDRLLSEFRFTSVASALPAASAAARRAGPDPSLRLASMRGDAAAVAP